MRLVTSKPTRPRPGGGAGGGLVGHGAAMKAIVDQGCARRSNSAGSRPARSGGWSPPSLRRHEAGGASAQRDHGAHRMPGEVGEVGRVALEARGLSVPWPVAAAVRRRSHMPRRPGRHRRRGPAQGSGSRGEGVLRCPRLQANAHYTALPRPLRPVPVVMGRGSRHPAVEWPTFPTVDAGMSQLMMKALVKREARASGWEQVPVPDAGPDPKCQSSWRRPRPAHRPAHLPVDDWSQRTIKPGLVIGQ